MISIDVITGTQAILVVLRARHMFIKRTNKLLGNLIITFQTLVLPLISNDLSTIGSFVILQLSKCLKVEEKIYPSITKIYRMTVNSLLDVLFK